MEQAISVKELIELLTYLGEEKMIEYKDGLTVEALISDGLDAMGKAMETALDNSADLTEEESVVLNDYDFRPLDAPQPFIPWNNGALDECVELSGKLRSMIKASVDGSTNPIISQVLQYYIPMDPSMAQAYMVNIKVNTKVGARERFVVDVKSVRISNSNTLFTIRQQLLHIRGGRFADIERMITTSIASHYAYVRHQPYDERMYQMVKARLMNLRITFRHYVTINDETSSESMTATTFERSNTKPIFRNTSSLEFVDGDISDDLTKFMPSDDGSDPLIIDPYDPEIGNSVFANTKFTTVESLSKDLLRDYSEFIRRWRENDPDIKKPDTADEEIPTPQNSTNN